MTWEEREVFNTKKCKSDERQREIMTDEKQREIYTHKKQVDELK